MHIKNQFKNVFKKHSSAEALKGPKAPKAPDGHVSAKPFMKTLRSTGCNTKAYQNMKAMREVGHDRMWDGDALQEFMTMTDSEIKVLVTNLGLPHPNDVKEFQKFLCGDEYHLASVFRFVDGWKNKDPGEFRGREAVEPRVNALKNVCITFRHTPEERDVEGNLIKPQGKFDIGSQAGAAVLNAASLTLWGKSGAADAMQRGSKGLASKDGRTFKDQQQAHRKKHGNFVRNVNTADAHTSELVTKDDKPLVIVSVAGPNVAHNTTFGFKVPRLFRKGPTKKQEMQLRASYRSYIESVVQYNKKAEQEDQPLITEFVVPTLSAGVFAYPKGPAAQILLEEMLRARSANPKMDITILNAFDEVLRDEINARLNLLGEGRSNCEVQGIEANASTSNAQIENAQNSEFAPLHSSQKPAVVHEQKAETKLGSTELEERVRMTKLGSTELGRAQMTKLGSTELKLGSTELGRGLFASSSQQEVELAATDLEELNSLIRDLGEPNPPR